MNTLLSVKNIRRAQIRYFEVGKNGCEIPDIKAYIYFYKINEQYYINMFHPCEECNVYDRVPYSNETKSGESFGTMLKLVTGKEEDGVCYVLDKNSDAISDVEYISIEDLQKKILMMDEFVVDRIFIEQSMNILNRCILKDVIKKDNECLKELQDYINSKENEKKLIKQ